MSRIDIPPDNPIARFVETQGVLILDGGLATELEARGHDLHDELWSARLLLDAPEEISRVHTDYLAAGADCVTTVTYQATVPGFRKRGLSDHEAADLIRYAVRLAVDARDAFWREPTRREGRLRPLVAASVGPYGAFLADGSEYTGDYDIDEDALYWFHRVRWHLLSEGPADVIACETIPSGPEAGALLRLLGESPGRWAWMSFSCRDEGHLWDGTPLTEVAAACDAEPGVMAVGVNCVPPGAVEGSIATLRDATSKPLMAYPNSGERYRPRSKEWVGPADVVWEDACAAWVASGVAGVGGCCRVGPDIIAAMRRRLVG